MDDVLRRMLYGAGLLGTAAAIWGMLDLPWGGGIEGALQVALLGALVSGASAVRRELMADRE